jgi:hypothetical protein
MVLILYANSSFKQGDASSAAGSNSHAEGSGTDANGDYSHAEGHLSTSTGNYSHAEGYDARAVGLYSHAEGSSTQASASYSHAEGESTSAAGYGSHAEGIEAIARGANSHAEGNTTQANGTTSHAEGYFTIATGSSSHAEGNTTIASGSYSHAEGNGSLAQGTYSHAEGDTTTAVGSYSHAEGSNTLTLGNYSHAEGEGTQANGNSSHAEGYATISTGSRSHAEGWGTFAQGEASHAEGQSTQALGDYSHAEGYGTFASGDYSHAEGYGTFAGGEASHAEGDSTFAIGNYSHAAGAFTSASGDYQSVIGMYNQPNTNQGAFIIGNGTGTGARSNLLYASGSSVEITGSLYVSRSDNPQKSSIFTSPGSKTEPAYTFIGDEDTGMYNHAANTVALTGGGNIRVQLSDTELRLAPGTTTAQANILMASNDSIPLISKTAVSSITVGAATDATNATNLNVLNSTTNASYPFAFSTSTTPGNKPLYTDTATTCYINPSTNVIGATTFIGALTGNASTATTASFATNALTASFLNTLNQNVTITKQGGAFLSIGAGSYGGPELRLLPNSTAGFAKINVGNGNSSLDFQMNSSTKATLTQNGLLGIGTTNPESGVHVQRDASGPVFYTNLCAVFGDNKASGSSYTNSVGVAGRVLQTGSRAIYGDASTGGGWAGYFDGKGYFSGSVGISIDSPQTKLHIEDVTKTLTSNVAGVAQGTLSLVSTDAQAADKGASLVFGGNYINSNETKIAYAGITGRKSNSSSVNADGYLSFLTWRSTGLTEAMRINPAGNVGIGTNNPTAVGTNITTLDIKGSSGGGVRSGVAGGSESTFYTIAAGGYLGTISNIPLSFQTNNSVKAIITNGGAMGLGITPTNTAGRFEASNDIVAYSTSDKRWKNNIVKIDSPLEKISQISGVEFDWIEDEPLHGNKGHDVGVIAQEIELVIPEAVQTRESGMKAVQYDKIIPLLIESIKEQQKQIDELKELVNGYTR